ncbi:hypothetical protein P3X46_011327 [Hevea brasiliensis]|uniref:Leucine-rich repeat-containing N-terminal plant-type domain-containing protein n=1 Tax=Hevea brasiliensis TaxID=3981 RepID=A0ABQ9MGV7_HEVBR|nr:hypothetical protein P3X46_011327 [Hevea brasiliensis]
MTSATFTLPFLWFALLATIISLGPCQGSLSGDCIQSEREALLNFKHDLIDPSNRLASWGGDVDCCGWSGVICDNLTSNVLGLHLGSLSQEEYYAFNATADYYEYRETSIFGGKISRSLLNLKHLKYLDLSNNDFGGISFPKFLGSMESLTHLNLSSAGFGGMIPHELGNLSNLQYLNLFSPYPETYVENLNWIFAGFGGMIPHQLGNLSNLNYLNLHSYYYFYYSEPYVENLDWISSLSSLQFLDMTFVNLHQATKWLNVINTLPCLEELYFSVCYLSNVPPFPNVNFSSLSVLDLSGNLFQGPVLDFLQNITSLKELDLAFNNFSSSIPYWLYAFSNLELLNLRQNQLQGKISSDIGNMTSLVSLDLSLNKLDGRIPASFQNLCNLKSLINDILEILLACVSNGLEILDLADCQLSGHLPNNLGEFKNLYQLLLSANSISGPIPISLGDLTWVKIIDLSQNNLNGSLPSSFGGLGELESVDLSYNLLEGDVSAVHFANLTKLYNFRPSGNQLRLRVDPNWNPPPHINEINLGSWKIGPHFPHWIRSLKFLSSLNLSNSGIASTIPVWFWNLSSNFYYLNISHNQIRGVIPNISNQVDGFSGSLVDLSSNSFQGPLPYMFSNVRALYLSNNSFCGPISKFLCYKMHELGFLQVLDLGGNLLSGEIPDCWMKWKWLVAIFLGQSGTLSSLESLHLRNNNLSGEIPASLQNCTKLSTLDFGENGLEGSIPKWIGETLSDIVILNLRTNKFKGHIPKELCLMTSLRILDFADNNISGTIPKCLNNFSAMISKDDSIGILMEGDASSWPFLESTFIVTKSNMNGYSNILKFVRFIDLSKNKLEREIPKEITSLKRLQQFLQNTGAMELLEVMEFSQNKLFGEIPQSPPKLTFLSNLNLSFNNLRGTIPSSSQLQSLNSSCFTGNEELCGLSLKNCSVDGATLPIGSKRVEDDKGSKSFA